MRGDDEGVVAAPIRRTRVCSHSNASCHFQGHLKDRPNAEAGHQSQRRPSGASGPRLHAHSHAPAVKLCVEDAYKGAVDCEESEQPSASQDASAGFTWRTLPVRTPQRSRRRADRSCDSAQPHATTGKAPRSPYQSAALLDEYETLQAGASASTAKTGLAGTHRVSPRSQGDDQACKKSNASHQLTSGHLLPPQRVLPSRVLRAAASLALLLVVQVWQVAVACWWQSVREALRVCGESCRRCSFGFQVAAAGLLRRVPGKRGWRAAALSGCVKLLQLPGDVLRNVATRAAEASYSAAAATQAARATALGTAQAVGSKWSLISRGGRAAARHATTTAPISFSPPSGEAPSLQLTPEEALATGKQTQAQLQHHWCCRLACDLWASIHRECPSQHVGVLQFQELLRKRLTAKEGSLYLLLDDLEDAQQQAACDSPEPNNNVACSQHPSVACTPQKAASMQPLRDTRQRKHGALRRTAQSMVYAFRLALVILREVHMECSVVISATKRLLKFARRSLIWVPTRAARLARSTSSAAAAVSLNIPWEALCATVGWTKAAVVAARHTRSSTNAGAPLPLHP
ncbi:hypothetical protein Emed_004771 [Eimeria media]